MNKKAIFIIKDHKTYMNAEEARFEFCDSDYKCILIFIIPFGDPNNVVSTIREALDYSLWDEVSWFKSFSNYNSKNVKKWKNNNRLFHGLMSFFENIFNFIDVKRLDIFSRKFQKADLVFMVHRNMHEHFAARVFNNEAYLLDSGQTLDKITDSGYIDYRRPYMRSFIKRWLFRIAGFKIIGRDRVKLFTVYAKTAVTKHQVIENKHKFKRSLVKEKAIGEKVLFISSPFYKFKTGIDIDVYVEYLIAVIEYLEIDPRQFIYVPNPVRETKEDVNFIIKKLGCDLDDRLIPVESKVTTYDYLPKLCVTPSSTAIVNISLLSENKIPCIIAWHPEFDCFEFLVKWKQDIISESEMNIKFEIIKNSPSFFNTGN